MAEGTDLEWHPLGELLVERGLVSREDVRLALEIQERTGQMLGEVLLSLGLVGPSDVAQALGDQYDVKIRRARWEWERSLETPPEPKQRVDASGRPRRLLGQVLLESGLISEDGLTRALREQRHTGMLLGEILVARRWLSAEDIERALADQRNGPVAEERPEPVYEVWEGGRAEPLARSCDFLDATDVAFDALDDHDPDALRIVKLYAGGEETVWEYDRPAPAKEAPRHERPHLPRAERHEPQGGSGLRAA